MATLSQAPNASRIFLRPNTYQAAIGHICEWCGKRFLLNIPAQFWWEKCDEAFPVCAKCAGEQGYTVDPRIIGGLG